MTILKNSEKIRRNNIKFFYSASVMGYGFGRRWHNRYNLPNFPRVTKSLTMSKKTGLPFAVIPFKDSVWNRVGLHNIGLPVWIDSFKKEDLSNIIVSISGSTIDINYMILKLLNKMNIKGIEINCSCPNAKRYVHSTLPHVEHPLYLKLSYDQDPYKYDLDKTTGIRMNSISVAFGAVSGKASQEKNWKFIEKFNKEGLNVAGCSITSIGDIKQLENMGCKEIGLGSIVLTNPKLIERIRIKVNKCLL